MHDEPRLLRWHLRLLSERYYTRHLLVEDVIDLCHTYNHNTHVVVALAALIFLSEMALKRVRLLVDSEL